MAYVNQADGSGKLDIDGHNWPVSYRVISKDEGDGTKSIHVELSAPRDWLLERGFRSAAKLVRENGTQIDIHSPADIGTGDPLAIHLRSEATRISSQDEALQEFPELTTH
jgi:hypothetical protein